MEEELEEEEKLEEGEEEMEHGKRDGDGKRMRRGRLSWQLVWAHAQMLYSCVLK
jgi:hypothetical protein